MQISGLRIHILLGSREVLRSPGWWVESVRHLPLGRAGVTLPDPDGALRRSVAIGDPLEIRLGYRDQKPASWQGSVTWLRPGATADQVEIGAVDGAAPLAATRITQSWENETPEAIIAWAVRQTGLAVGRIDSTGVTLPRFVASSIPVWQVATQAAASCQRGFDIDMRRWAMWRGRAGAVNWGDFDEPGETPVVATAAGLIGHCPDSAKAGLNRVETFLLPGLSHSQLFRLQDARRGVDDTFRALRVRHQGAPDKVRTFIWYGDEYGRF